MSDQAPSPPGTTTVANAAGDAEVVGAAAAPPVETVTFTLDGREVTATKGEMLIAAAERCIRASAEMGARL